MFGYSGPFLPGRLIDSLSLPPPQARPRLQRGGSSASLHNSLMRNSIFQLMIHTLDPLSEGKAEVTEQSWISWNFQDGLPRKSEPRNGCVCGRENADV